MEIIKPSPDGIERRGFLRGGGKLAVTGAALAILAGSEGIARAAGTAAEADIVALNTILGLDHEAVAAYDIAIGSGLLTADVIPVARQFRDHHKGHRDTLILEIERAGGRPAEAKTIQDYVVDIDAASLENQAQVLQLAASLEGAAVNVYINAIPGLGTEEHARLVSRLVADETMHWTVLTTALGEGLPQQALFFGA